MYANCQTSATICSLEAKTKLARSKIWQLMLQVSLITVVGANIGLFRGS